MKLPARGNRVLRPVPPPITQQNAVANGEHQRASTLRKLSLQSGIIFGPVQSRRLGCFLGINLLPADYKVCSLDCIYCQYDWTKKLALISTDQLKKLPTPAEVATALETVLQNDPKGVQDVDSITVCGNGEPTLYPQLAEIITVAKQLRDRYLPRAQLAILSNSSTVGDSDVRAALEQLDLKIMKFDAGSEELFQELNHPRAPVYMGDIVTGLKELNNIVLQSLFVQGRVTNADLDSVELWLEKVREIRPLRVQVYTLESEPADKRVEKVSLTTLQWIAEQVHWHAGVPVELF